MPAKWGSPKGAWAMAGLITAAAVLRLVRLDTLPPGLFRDEAEKGCTAYSILLTGRDLSGHLLPLFTNVFGVTTSVLYQYIAVPFIAVFGLNEWGVRLPAAAAGTITLLVNWRFMERERGRTAAVWASVFLALSPWHIVFSRWAQQGILLPLLLSAAMLAWRGFLRGSKAGLPVAAGCFAAAVYAYEVARLFVPLLMLLILILYWRELLVRRRETAIAALVFAIVSTPVARLALTQPAAAQARFNAISILGQGLSLWETVGWFLHNYIVHFSPGFLLIHGDAEMRHSAGVGVLTGAEFVAMLFGLGVLLRRRTREDWIWIAWLALFPVAASLTRIGIPHALRTIVAIPAIQNIAGIGVGAMLDRAQPQRRAALQRHFCLIAVLTFLPFAITYYTRYARRSAISWQYGVKQAMELLRPEMQRIDQIVFYNVTGAEYLTAFYGKTAPKQIQTQGFQNSKLQFPPFGMPLDRLYAQRSSLRAAYVMLPFYPGPEDSRAIYLSLGKSGSPAMVIYLNSSLLAALGKK